MQSVTFSFFRFDGLGGRIWAFGQMGLARFALARLPELGFFKLLGSGTGQGFTPIPNTAVYAIMATWPDHATAKRMMAGARVFQDYHRRADETCTLFLEPSSAQGAWSGKMPFEPQGSLPEGPIVALTRATVRPSRALRFWRRVPDISRVIGTNRNVLFKIGVGEVPLLHQVTFSIWPDAQSMAEFARRDGPHAQAIRAVREGQWFSEELYARFRLAEVTGTWAGVDPLHSAKVEQQRIAA